MRPKAWPISCVATWTRSVSQTPATQTGRKMKTASLAPQPAAVKERDAFLPAEAHVPQNPVLMVVEVDLAGLGKERVSQFSCDAIEAVVQVGLETVGVVVGVESCQDRKPTLSLRRPACCAQTPPAERWLMACPPQRFSFSLDHAVIGRFRLTVWGTSNLVLTAPIFSPLLRRSFIPGRDTRRPPTGREAHRS